MQRKKLRSPLRTTTSGSKSVSFFPNRHLRGYSSIWTCNVYADVCRLYGTPCRGSGRPHWAKLVVIEAWSEFCCPNVYLVGVSGGNRDGAWWTGRDSVTCLASPFWGVGSKRRLELRSYNIRYTPAHTSIAEDQISASRLGSFPALSSQLSGTAFRILIRTVAFPDDLEGLSRSMRCRRVLLPTRFRFDSRAFDCRSR